MNGVRRAPSQALAADGSKFPKTFMAGRGRVLQEMRTMPLEAEEFARRKRIQEQFKNGEISLEEGNIPESLLRLQTTHSIKEIAKKSNTTSPKSQPLANSTFFSSPNPQETKQAEFMDRTISEIPAGTEGSLGNIETADNRENQSLELKMENMGIQEESEAKKDNPDLFISKNASKPLRKPEKSRNKYVNVIKEDIFITNSADQMSTNTLSNFMGKHGNNNHHDNAWKDWEQSVVIEGSLAEEDLQEIAVVEDNDDINDVIVNQYIDALHKQQKKETKPLNNKITPNRVQQLSKLKSTSNADCTRVAPGTLPNPPRGDDRWGGIELKQAAAPVGWGNLESSAGNWYNDGSSYWGATASNPLGGVSWSNCS